jgi:S-layer protein
LIYLRVGLASINSLTTGLDNVTGAAGDDVFNASLGTGATLTPLDAIDGGIGNNVLNLSDLSGASSLPPALQIKNIQTLKLQSAGAVGTSLATPFDTSTGFTGLTSVNVNLSAGADFLKAGAGQAVTVVDTAGSVSLVGGSTQTVVTAGGVALSGATGAVTAIDTAQGTVASTIDGGTDIALNTTASGTGTSGTVVIGGVTKPTGVVTVTQNLKGTGAGGLNLTGGALSVNGGSTVNVNVNATQSTPNITTNIGAITVNGGLLTTNVSVSESAAVAPAAGVTATPAATEVDSVVFAGLTPTQTLTFNGLTFTAATTMTAAQTAAAFSGLSAGATQGTSNKGAYSGVLGAGYNTGPVTGTATVAFTGSTAGTLAAPTFGGTGTAPSVTNVTTGVTAVPAILAASGIAPGTVTVADVNSGDPTKTGTISTIAVTNYSSVTINDNALSILSVTGGSGNITVTNLAAVPTNKTLGLTLSGVTGGTLSDSNIYTTLNLNSSGSSANTLANIADTALTALNVSGTQNVTLTSTAGAPLLKTVTVTGSSGLNASVTQATLTAIDTSGSTGTSNLTFDATKATYTGGAGVDLVTTSAGVSKTIALGDGADKLTLAVGTSVLTAVIDGGLGIDVLSMAAADAATASLTGTFASRVTGFESIELTGLTGSPTVAVDTLGFANRVSIGATAGVSPTLALTGFATGGTLTISGDQDTTGGVGGTTLTNTTWTAGTADNVNVTLSKSGALAGGNLTIQSVESIAINAIDTSAAAVAGAATDTLTLNANAAKTFTITGNAALALTNNAGNTALTLIDASGMTGGLTASTNGSVAEVIKGGASANALTALTGTTADTLVGGIGSDTLTANAGLDVLTGGPGRDTFVIATPSSNLNGYSTITDASSGDAVKFLQKGTEVFTPTKLVLGDTAVFQDYANLAAQANVAANGVLSWFQFAGNTYIVEDVSTSTSFVNGSDIVVKLTGLVDLSASSINTTGGPTLLIV